MARFLILRATRLSSLMRELITLQRLALMSIPPLENDLKERGRIGESGLEVIAQSRLWCSLGCGQSMLRYSHGYGAV